MAISTSPAPCTDGPRSPTLIRYYAGPGTCNGLCASAKIGELITFTVANNDAAIDFGQYDNDGPDGLPNSGDDDGFVDFAAFIQPETSSSCGGASTGNIWSHRSSLSTDYVTNDPRTGGGFILVDDYVIQNGFNCDGVNIVDIGVFCHEYGHAFGLPDLYDTDGGSQGVGHWCLMGSGNQNTTSNPAHMGAWSKNQLGWSDVTVVPGVPTPFSISNVENNRDIYRLDVMHEKWRRTTDCAINGTFSMHCGLTASEAALRNYVGGAGYGNRWDTTLSRDFFWMSGTVNLSYKYSYETEPSYDYLFTDITTNGNTTTLATYTGTGSGTASINITPFLAFNKPFTIKFHFMSDPAWSDEDGLNPTTCGAVTLDDISVASGGTSNSTNFETREDGWAEEMTNPAEHYLVENRQPLGSDVNVWGGGGLVIWHVDSGDQTGGPSNNQPRRLAVEQADGLFDLEANINRGDAGDPYPGSTNNLNFNGATTPSSDGHDGPAHVSVQLTSGNGDPITATMMGSWPAPSPVSISPTSRSGQLGVITVDGSGFAKGGYMQLARGTQTFTSQLTTWVGKDRVGFSIVTAGAINGFYDVVVFNPGGASAVLPGAFEIKNSVVAVGDTPRKNAMLAAYPNPFNPETTIRYELASRQQVSLRVYDVSGAVVRTLVDDTKPAGSYTLTWNGLDDRGNTVSSGVYFYRITAGSFSDVRKMTLVK